MIKGQQQFKNEGSRSLQSTSLKVQNLQHDALLLDILVDNPAHCCRKSKTQFK
jgi:hypothetical protein